MTITKEYIEQVLNKVSTHAIVKEYRVDDDPIYIFDLVIINGENIEVLATDRFVLVSESEFTLTEEELKQLQNGATNDNTGI